MEYKEIAKTLTTILNKLMEIHTCGQDSFIIVEIIKNLNFLIQYLNEISKNQENQEE